MNFRSSDAQKHFHGIMLSASTRGVVAPSAAVSACSVQNPAASSFSATSCHIDRAFIQQKPARLLGWAPSLSCRSHFSAASFSILPSTAPSCGLEKTVTNTWARAEQESRGGVLVRHAAPGTCHAVVLLLSGRQAEQCAIKTCHLPCSWSSR